MSISTHPCVIMWWISSPRRAFTRWRSSAPVRADRYFCCTPLRPTPVSKGARMCCPDDVKRLAKPVLAHRIILRPEARSKGSTAETVIAEILSQIPVPATM